MNIKIVNENVEKAVLHISGSIDIPSAEDLKRSLFQVSDAGARHVILDFKEVKSIGSSGIGALILFHKEFTALGGKTQIVNANKEIKSLFQIINLGALMEIH